MCFYDIKFLFHVKTNNFIIIILHTFAKDWIDFDKSLPNRGFIEDTLEILLKLKSYILLSLRFFINLYHQTDKSAAINMRFVREEVKDRFPFSPSALH